MGRGIAYPHDYFMLYDESFFVVQPEDDDGNETGEPFFDEEDHNNFKDEVVEAFGAVMDSKSEWVDREAHLFAHTDRLRIGIDSSGGGPCVFVVPKCYRPFGDWNREEEVYEIDKDVARAFNKLTHIYPTMFTFPTTAWTSHPYGKWYREPERRKAA